MKQGIIVCTWSGGEPWASLCIESLLPIYGAYPLYLVVNDYKNSDDVWVNALSKFMNILGVKGDYRELGAIKSVINSTDLDEFWLFQDTVEITDTSFINSTFEQYPGITASYMPNYMQFYLGKWKTSVIKELEIPLPKDKMEAVIFEHTFSNTYLAADPEQAIIIDPLMRYEDKRTNYMDSMFNEDRLAVVGKFLIKRISIVKENMRTEDGVGFIPNDDIEKWKKLWRRMVYP